MFNLHTHCSYCDGKGKPIDFIKEAINQEFSALGFSSHAPLPFDNSFSIKEEEIPNYVNEILYLREQYKKILPIFCGLECDFIPNMSQSFHYFKQKYNLDYIIGGVHLINYNKQLWFIDGKDPQTYDDGLFSLFGGDIKKAVKHYFHQLCEMIETETFDILAHFDKIKMHNKNRYFTEDEKWYINFIEETIRLIKEKLLIVEINTRGIYKKRCDTFYPSPWIIKKLQEHSIPVTISTDAHNKNEISLYFHEAMNCLNECGIKNVETLRGMYK
jgi:histidinol-phosphatase (PHP family)